MQEYFEATLPNLKGPGEGLLQFKLDPLRHLSRPHETMTDEFQIHIPPSFMALFVPPGKIKPVIGQRDMAVRYELCEDMAQLLTDPTATQQFQLGITEDLALDRCLQGLLAEPAVVNEAEARWVVCRLAELLQWPLPAWVEPSAA